MSNATLKNVKIDEDNISVVYLYFSNMRVYQPGGKLKIVLMALIVNFIYKLRSEKIWLRIISQQIRIRRICFAYFFPSNQTEYMRDEITNLR